MNESCHTCDGTCVTRKGLLNSYSNSFLVMCAGSFAPAAITLYPSTIYVYQHTHLHIHTHTRTHTHTHTIIHTHTHVHTHPAHHTRKQNKYGASESVILRSHAWTIHVTNMIGACRTHEWVISRTWMSHLTHMNESSYTCEWGINCQRATSPSPCSPL